MSAKKKPTKSKKTIAGKMTTKVPAWRKNGWAKPGRKTNAERARRKK